MIWVGIIAFGLMLVISWHTSTRPDATAQPPVTRTNMNSGDVMPPALSNRPVLQPLPALSDAEYQARERAERRQRQSQANAIVDTGRRNLESEFASESLDPVWSRAKETELEKFVLDPQMEAIGAIPTAFTVACKSSVCRIVAAFPSKTAAEDWTSLYVINNGGLLSRVSYNHVLQPDGTMQLELIGSTRK